MCVSVALSADVSLSSAALTVTVCAVLQPLVVNVRLLLSTPKSVPVVPPIVTVTSPLGCVASATVYVALSPSITGSVATLSSSPTVSSSVTVTARSSLTDP